MADEEKEIMEDVEEDSDSDDEEDSEEEESVKQVGEAAEEMDDDEEDEDDMDEVLIHNLEKAISANPYSYDVHVSLIDALRKYGELEKVRAARQRFASLFPLSPKLWLEWINDERRIDTPWQEVHDLFEKAVQDYLSVQIWLEYIQVACGNLGPNEMRDLCERALSHVGLHVADGRLIWDAYRIFESALAESGGGGTDQLLQIYKRQLSLPLIGSEDTKQEFIEAFGEEKFDGALSQTYNAAMEELRALAILEKDLISSEYSLDTYLRYLDREEGHRDGASTTEGQKEKSKEKSVNIPRLQCLYERAITDHCLSIDLWLRYVNWLDTRFTSTGSITDVVLPVYERAVRNYSWSATLWTKYSLAHERSRVENWCKNADAVLARATDSGYSSVSEAIDLWLTWAYQKRRAADAGLCEYGKVEEIFENGATFLKQKFGDGGWDPSSSYRRSWATYLASQSRKHDGDSAIQKLSKARDLWKDILNSDGNGRLASVWLECYQFERQFGDLKETRTTLYKALNSVTDFPDYIASTLKQYELEEGDLHSLDEAMERIRKQKARLEERKLQQHALTTTSKQRGRKEAMDQPKRNEGKRKNFDQSESPAKKQKFDNRNRGTKSGGEFVEPAPRKSKTVEFAEPEAKKSEAEPSEFVKPAPPSWKKSSDISETERRRRTIFVSNLNFYLKEEQLKEAVEELGVGQVVDVRLMMLTGGRSKGFGYVELESAECVQKALAKDRHLIDGRPMYISEYKERGGDATMNKMEKAAGMGEKNAAAEKYHFGSGLEKKKLFVRNIPKHATDADLRVIFEPHGALKSMRLVTFPSGQSKGIAYIEYENEESASKALVSTDGQVLFEKPLEVALSNPPPRRTGAFSNAGKFQPKGANQKNEDHPKEEHPSQANKMLPRVLGAGGRKPRVNLE